MGTVSWIDKFLYELLRPWIEYFSYKGWGDGKVYFPGEVAHAPFNPEYVEMIQDDVGAAGSLLILAQVIVLKEFRSEASSQDRNKRTLLFSGKV